MKFSENEKKRYESKPRMHPCPWSHGFLRPSPLQQAFFKFWDLKRLPHGCNAARCSRSRGDQSVSLNNLIERCWSFAFEGARRCDHHYASHFKELSFTKANARNATRSSCCLPIVSHDRFDHELVCEQAHITRRTNESLLNTCGWTRAYPRLLCLRLGYCTIYGNWK